MYTPTEQRMLDLLSDGFVHTKEELKRCLWDELARIETVQVHISNLRKKLRPQGRDIICNHQFDYQQVRLMHKS
jgi:DNA-binding response OmpR family regulator